MKKILFLFIASGLGFTVNAQINTPAPSPFSTLEQKVGLTDVVIEYSRPSMRGRTIFGDLVPYDQIWRTGANLNTTISFSDDVTIGNQTLAAGKYALYTKPGKSTWEVYFYTDTNNGGTPAEWEDSKVAAKTTTQVIDLPIDIETFTIGIDDLNNNGATLGLLWSNVYVGVPLGVPTVDKAVKSIEETMSGPGANDYFAAATYYQEEGRDLQKAKEWIDKAASINGAFWILRRKSLIYAELGDKKGAIEAARKSLAAAEAEGNQDYVKLNQDSLKEWGAL